MDGFVALRPRDDTRAIRELACQCTRRLDCFRAPPAADEIARREPAGLTERQQRVMARWGYPYAMEEYRFHMTLTGPIHDSERVRVIAALAPHVERLNRDPLRLDALCLFRQAGADAPFVLLRRYGFDGTMEVYSHD
jgi:hypothetical protein